MIEASARRERAVVHAHGASGWLVREAAIMGTAIRVELWNGEAGHGEAAIDAVMAEMHRIDAAMSPYKDDSELSRVNREAGRAPVPLSAELFNLIGASLRFSAQTDGAFDITTASAGFLYDYRRGVAPDAAALARAQAAIGWRHVLLDTRAGTLRFAQPDTKIDLGGFAKGYAVENGAAILRRFGIRHGIVSAGGDSRIIGDRRGRPWSIGIRHPRDEKRLVAVLPLEDVAVSTSGDYERFFERDGLRHHHLIDPASGASPREVQAVTVVAPDGLTSEALSKAVFVLGIERGLGLVHTFDGVDAIAIDAAGRLRYSAGLQPGRHAS